MNEHNTNFLDGKEVYYHIESLRYAYIEIERLRNEIKKISEQHIYTLDKLIETQTRIEKTIEYIKSNYIDNPIEFKKDLLNILNGGDE